MPEMKYYIARARHERPCSLFNSERNFGFISFTKASFIATSMLISDYLLKVSLFKIRYRQVRRFRFNFRLKSSCCLVEHILSPVLLFFH